MAKAAHHLTNIAFSHYVEKARWALKRFGVDYSESNYLPMVHFLPVYLVHQGKRGKTDKASSRFSTPVLQTPSGDILCDSADIVRYASVAFGAGDTDLYPNEECAELEKRFSEKLGPHSRRIVYQCVFSKPELLIYLAKHNVGPFQRYSFQFALPVIENKMREVLNINEEAMRRSVVKVEEEFAFVEELLSDGRPYLCGDRFTAADLAFGALGSPCILPSNYGAKLPALSEFPTQYAEMIENWRTTKAGQFIARLYAEERDRVVVTN